jgi:hypothetical protein
MPLLRSGPRTNSPHALAEAARSDLVTGASTAPSAVCPGPRSFSERASPKAASPKPRRSRPRRRFRLLPSPIFQLPNPSSVAPVTHKAAGCRFYAPVLEPIRRMRLLKLRAPTWPPARPPLRPRCVPDREASASERRPGRVAQAASPKAAATIPPPSFSHLPAPKSLVRRPGYAQSGRMPLLRVIMTTYDPVSENLAATEPGTGGEAEGNCVAARRGGKQPEAKEQSQRQLNSIRCEFAASLRGTGEACEKSNPSSRHRPANARDGANWHGWSENAPKEVCVSGESCADRHRARSARTVQQSEPPYERGSPVTRMEQREAGK